MSWNKAQDLLAPLRETPQVGNSIAARQPDVEILAVLLQDTPTTAAAFDALRRNQEWVSVSFAVVAVGPAGFSSVPYTTGKKDKDENTLPLYGVSEKGTTEFKTFKKVKNNKDRGERVLTMEVDGVSVPATAELPPGLILSTFLREDVFAGSNSFVVADEDETPEVLPAGSFVWMQIGVKNVEQAAKGQLLKFKRIKFCRQPSHAMSTAYRLMPRDKDACLAVCKEAAAAYPAIAKQIYAAKNTVMGAEVHPRAYATYSEVDQTVTLTDYEDRMDCPELIFDAEQLLREHDFYDPARLLRWLNCVAIPSGAVGVVALAQAKYDDDSVTYKGVAMHIDISRVLQLPLLQGVERLPASSANGPTAGLFVSMHDDLLLWSNPAVRLRVQQGDEERGIVFVLRTKPKAMISALAHNPRAATRFISDGCAGVHNTLAVHSVPLVDEDGEPVAWDEACAQVLSSMKQRDGPRPAPAIIVLQLRNENRGVAVHKRKRPVFEMGTDARDMDMLEALAEASD